MIKHYFVTVATFNHIHIHGYVMTDDRFHINDIASRMVDIAENNGLQPMGLVLTTELSKPNGKPDQRSIDLVRGTVIKMSPEAERTMKETKNYHLSIWSMPEDHPDNEPLMKLH